MTEPSGPEITEAEGNRIEGGDAYGIVPLCAPDRHPLPFTQIERLQGAVNRIHKPQMPHVFTRINRALHMQVKPARRGGEHFANPIGRHGEIRRAGVVRHPIPTPPGKVGNQDVLGEMQFRFVNYPPSAGAPATELERW